MSAFYVFNDNTSVSQMRKDPRVALLFRRKRLDAPVYHHGLRVRVLLGEHRAGSLQFFKTYNKEPRNQWRGDLFPARGHRWFDEQEDAITWLLYWTLKVYDALSEVVPPRFGFEPLQETPFIPGPWSADEDESEIRQTDSDACIAVMHGIDDFPCLDLNDDEEKKVLDEMHANKLLVAAAPMLYEYLRMAIVDTHTELLLADQNEDSLPAWAIEGRKILESIHAKRKEAASA